MKSGHLERTPEVSVAVFEVDVEMQIRQRESPDDRHVGGEERLVAAVRSGDGAGHSGLRDRGYRE